ncbi:MAG: FHA domain-containing protein, partial [Anaerolineae bacterium]|nr:FHA domain-containing protein [Anaerolineae bacterium]
INGQRVNTPWLLQNGAIVELGDSITLEYDRGVFPRSDDVSIDAESVIARSGEPVFRYSLMITMGPDTGNIYPLNGLIITVGRDLSNDIVIQDPEISRFHMRLRRDPDGYTVEDMGSTNGTYVNNLEVTQPYPLKANDVLRLARQVRLQFVTQLEDVSIGLNETAVIGDHRDRHLPSDTRAGGSLSTIRTTGLLTRGVPTSNLPLRTGKFRPSWQTSTFGDSVFVAYARADWDGVVGSMVTSFQQAGVQAWVDQYLVQHGDDWRAALELALNECWAMVVVVSTASLASNYVKMAYRHFSTYEKPLISLIAEPETTLPPDLSHARSILFDKDNPQRSFHKLILEIMNLRR